MLDRLLRPWLGAGTRIVCADSYFASYEATAHLRLQRLRFMGVVKTATRKFLLRLLKATPVANRGRWLSVACVEENGDVAEMAWVWVDRERQFFISSTSRAASGTPYERTRWRQTENGPARVALTVE